METREKRLTPWEQEYYTKEIRKFKALIKALEGGLKTQNERL